MSSFYEAMRPTRLLLLDQHAYCISAKCGSRTGTRTGAARPWPPPAGTAREPSASRARRVALLRPNTNTSTFSNSSSTKSSRPPRYQHPAPALPASAPPTTSSPTPAMTFPLSALGADHSSLPTATDSFLPPYSRIPLSSTAHTRNDSFLSPSSPFSHSFALRSSSRFPPPSFLPPLHRSLHLGTLLLGFPAFQHDLILPSSFPSSPYKQLSFPYLSRDSPEQSHT
ncbi:hypothetical protein V8E36_006572 [Tilletia maclaganii]